MGVFIVPNPKYFQLLQKLENTSEKSQKVSPKRSCFVVVFVFFIGAVHPGCSHLSNISDIITTPPNPAYGGI